VKNLRRLTFALALLPTLAACEEKQCPPPAAPAPSASASAKAPTAEEAKAFVTKMNAELTKLLVTNSRAQWAYQTNITDDTEALASEGEEANAAYYPKAIAESRKFDGVALPEDVARQLKLLRVAPPIPAPDNDAERAELAQLETQMTGMYGKAEYCPARLANDKSKKCLNLGDLSRTLSSSRNYDELLEAWTGWHDTAKAMRAKYSRYVELANKGAKGIGFDDTGALWRSAYDMAPDAFSNDVERLWSDVKPMYEELHCFVRSKLREKYGKDKVGESSIPAHLLGNMWAQEWQDIYDLVEPFKGEQSLDVTKALKDKKYDPKKMIETGESFFKSLGFDPLPKTFWDRSLLTRPRDREVVCHPSAWDVTYSGDLRIKMCIEPTENDLVTIHHELGHDFYFSRYFKMPILFQQGANGGFHEAIGDTLALSVTPEYLKKLGLITEVPKGDHGRINQMMKSALDKVAFLPFGYVVDKWRWDVFSGKIPTEKYNEAWWALRAKYQGVAPASPRSEDAFDPGAKYHVASSATYVIYFLARIYQFQFHRALCKAAGYTGPIDGCSIYGNKAAGEKLIAMLSLGASKPWPEAMAVLGETKADASAMLEYYAPLRAWMKEQLKGEKCGW
jgi:peptidyl-dipeptidase A